MRFYLSIASFALIAILFTAGRLLAAEEGCPTNAPSALTVGIAAPKTTNTAPSVPLAAIQPPQKLRSTPESVATPPSAQRLQVGAYLEGVRVGAILARQNANAIDEDLARMAMRIWEANQKRPVAKP